ncbi:MAG: response regulator transcription factor [Ignavibacteria bacterium]
MKKIIRIKLLLVEDNLILRKGMMNIFRPYNDIQMNAATGSSANTKFNVRKVKPNVILLDRGLRSQNSLRTVEVLNVNFPEVKVIIMDLIPVHDDILKFIKAGASGFILKNATLDEFLKTIRSVANGENVLPEHLTDSLFSQIIEHAFLKGQPNIKYATLMTKREREVIGLISDAMTNKQISEYLKISKLTVKCHVHHILEKLSLKSRLELSNLSFKDKKFH